jgi:hypothetical protein
LFGTAGLFLDTENAKAISKTGSDHTKTLKTSPWLLYHLTRVQGKSGKWPVDVSCLVRCGLLFADKRPDIAQLQKRLNEKHASVFDRIISDSLSLNPETVQINNTICYGKTRSNAIAPVSLGIPPLLDVLKSPKPKYLVCLEWGPILDLRELGMTNRSFSRPGFYRCNGTTILWRGWPAPLLYDNEGRRENDVFWSNLSRLSLEIEQFRPVPYVCSND